MRSVKVTSTRNNIQSLFGINNSSTKTRSFNNTFVSRKKAINLVDINSLAEVSFFLIMKAFITVFISLLIINDCVFSRSLTGRSLSVIRDTVQDSGQKALEAENDPLIVRKCLDFSLTGTGNNIEWKKATWNLLTKLDSGGKDYRSRFKILYSEKGIYLLFNGEDEKITTQSVQDFGKIYEGDAFEVFFHPDHQIPVYFEYEINQLNKELILTISRKNNRGNSWAPWQNENEKLKYNRMVNIVGGKMKAGSLIRSWSAEVFFPYELLDLLPDVPPRSGTIWDANFCRLDYDSGNMIKWSWSPKIKISFHELDKFRSIKFE